MKKQNKLTESKFVVGLDLSLTHTGIAVFNGDDEYLMLDTVKSKPIGDTPTAELTRIKFIMGDVIEKLKSFYLGENNSIKLFCIEGIAFGIRGKTTSLDQLTALNYFIRDLALRYNIPFIIIPPTTNKKFVTGSGKGEKDAIMMHVLKNWDIECNDNNIADAVGLAKIGACVLDIIKPQNKAQEEVVKLIKKQLEQNDIKKDKTK